MVEGEVGKRQDKFLDRGRGEELVGCCGGRVGRESGPSRAGDLRRWGPAHMRERKVGGRRKDRSCPRPSVGLRRQRQQRFTAVRGDVGKVWTIRCGQRDQTQPLYASRVATRPGGSERRRRAPRCNGVTEARRRRLGSSVAGNEFHSERAAESASETTAPNNDGRPAMIRRAGSGRRRVAPRKVPYLRRKVSPLAPGVLEATGAAVGAYGHCEHSHRRQEPSRSRRPSSSSPPPSATPKTRVSHLPVPGTGL